MTEVLYKVKRHVDMVDNHHVFPLVGMSKIKGHQFKIRGSKIIGNLWSTFFTQTIVGF